MNNLPDFADLRVFCAVARRSSFVVAAHELGMSPAYVSQRITSLECQLGITLFHRTTRCVRISDQGKRAFGWAHRILVELEDMGAELAQSKFDLNGPLRISSSLRLGRNHIAPILSLLGKQFPKLDLWLELVNDRVDVIAEGIDIDLRVGAVNEPHLVTHRVIRSQRILCVAPSYLEQRGHPLSLADLAQHECLLFRGRDQTFGVWRLTGPSGLEAIKVTGHVGSNHSDIVRAWALDGYGIIMISDWDVASEIANGDLVRVLPAYSQQADVWAVTRTHLASMAKVRYGIEFLIANLREGPFALHGLGID